MANVRWKRDNLLLWRRRFESCGELRPGRLGARAVGTIEWVTQHRAIVVYSLYKIVDPDGNYLRVYYNENGRTVWPERIEYNLPEAIGGRSFAITFEYLDRPDKTPMPQYFDKRLNKVRVFGNWSTAELTGDLVRLYQLDYTISHDSGDSLLAAFKEFGSDGDLTGAQSLPPREFGYTVSERDVSEHTVEGGTEAWDTFDCSPSRGTSLHDARSRVSSGISMVTVALILCAPTTEHSEVK